VLVYISTFGEGAGRFGYELELPPPPGCEMPYQVAGRRSGVSFEELARAVAEHLGIVQHPGKATDGGSRRRR
jgi:hypothetical protein